MVEAVARAVLVSVCLYEAGAITTRRYTTISGWVWRANRTPHGKAAMVALWVAVVTFFTFHFFG